MPKPTLRDRLQFLSVTDVARELGLTISQVDLRIKQGIFPPPTAVKRSGLRLFSREWLDAARKGVLPMTSGTPGEEGKAP